MVKKSMFEFVLFSAFIITAGTSSAVSAQAFGTGVPISYTDVGKLRAELAEMNIEDIEERLHSPYIRREQEMIFKILLDENEPGLRPLLERHLKHIRNHSSDTNLFRSEIDILITNTLIALCILDSNGDDTKYPKCLEVLIFSEKNLDYKKVLESIGAVQNDEAEKVLIRFAEIPKYKMWAKSVRIRNYYGHLDSCAFVGKVLTFAAKNIQAGDKKLVAERDALYHRIYIGGLDKKDFLECLEPNPVELSGSELVIYQDFVDELADRAQKTSESKFPGIRDIRARFDQRAPGIYIELLDIAGNQDFDSRFRIVAYKMAIELEMEQLRLETDGEKATYLLGELKDVDEDAVMAEFQKTTNHTIPVWLNNMVLFEVLSSSSVTVLPQIKEALSLSDITMRRRENFLKVYSEIEKRNR